MDFFERLHRVLKSGKLLLVNPERRKLIEHVLANGEALASRHGALATWTALDSTGRSPKDTMIVKRPEVIDKIDWDSPNNIALEVETFTMIQDDVMDLLEKKERLYITDRVIGADSSYALPVQTITDRALTALFTDTMFRPIPNDLEQSIYHKKSFTIIALPMDKLTKAKYQGRLRQLPGEATSYLAVVLDFPQRLCIVIGSAYMGSVKKLMFTVMNYLLPESGILPLHASASEGSDGKTALFLGLSGTGKTTLSADPRRKLLGDDEHGWNASGIANFENGCYAKLINLNPEKEPQIYAAIMHRDEVLQHGAIVENALMYPDGTFDFADARLTENSRGSFPLSFLPNIKPAAKSGHPKTMVFLTADANGVLPPVARLNHQRAMLWFLLGYTSKLAGTETGIKDPVSTFSRFFGQPFMPRNPDAYASLLGEKIRKHRTQVYLINTGWSGGPYGVGKRMDIGLTRAIVNAALSGQLEQVEYWDDPLFHIQVPRSCPEVPAEVLNPRNTWQDKAAFEQRAKKLAAEFCVAFDKAYGAKKIPDAVRQQCPGK